MKRSKDFWANYFLPRGILIENILWKKKEKQKERTKFAKLHFEETKKLFPTWFNQVLCQNQGQGCTQQERFVDYLTEGCNNLLQELFFCDFLISVESN